MEPVEPVAPVSPPPAEPTVDVGTAPAEEEPVAVAPATVEPSDPTEPKIKLSEDLAAPKPPPVEPRSTAAIRSALRERFVEENVLRLVENRWHFPGESEPYTGRVKRWSEEGWKVADGNYKNGLQDGRWRTWWDNGLIRTAVNMKNGRADGEAKTWYKNGQIKEEGNWVDGKFIATAKWNEAGEEIPVK